MIPSQSDLEANAIFAGMPLISTIEVEQPNIPETDSNTPRVAKNAEFAKLEAQLEQGLPVKHQCCGSRGFRHLKSCNADNRDTTGVSAAD